MARRWEEIIRKTGQLSVFPGPSITGAWDKALNDAIKLINNLSLGVTLVPSSAPPTNAKTGANVQFEAIKGSKTFASFVGPITISLPGTTLEGETKAVGTRNAAIPNSGRLGQAFCCVPLTPQVHAGQTGSQIQREAGDPIKLVMAVHELLHATGLSNADHTKSPTPDVLFDPNSGSPGDPLDPAHPENDFLVLNGTGKIPAPRLPPIFLNPETSGKILTLWVLPDKIITHVPVIGF
jgi:hypothetical protein